MCAATLRFWQSGVLTTYLLLFISHLPTCRKNVTEDPACGEIWGPTSIRDNYTVTTMCGPLVVPAASGLLANDVTSVPGGGLFGWTKRGLVAL